MQSKDSDSGRHKSYNSILVERIRLPVECDVQEHDRYQLAGFGEDEGNVVHVLEAGVPKGG